MALFPDHDNRLKDAVERGYLNTLEQQDSELVRQWTAYQKVESLFAWLRDSGSSRQKANFLRKLDRKRPP